MPHDLCHENLLEKVFMIYLIAIPGIIKKNLDPISYIYLIKNDSFGSND